MLESAAGLQGELIAAQSELEGMRKFIQTTTFACGPSRRASANFAASSRKAWRKITTPVPQLPPARTFHLAKVTRPTPLCASFRFLVFPTRINTVS